MKEEGTTWSSPTQHLNRSAPPVGNLDRHKPSSAVRVEPVHAQIAGGPRRDDRDAGVPRLEIRARDTDFVNRDIGEDHLDVADEGYLLGFLDVRQAERDRGGDRLVDEQVLDEIEAVLGYEDRREGVVGGLGAGERRDGKEGDEEGRDEEEEREGSRRRRHERRRVGARTRVAG